LVNNVQRSYQRQQRVGERIADAKAKANQDQPIAEVDISAAAQEAAEAAKVNATEQKKLNIKEMANRFVDQFLAPPAAAQENAEGAEEGNESQPNTGRTAFVRLIDSFGLEVRQGEDGEDEAIVNKSTGEDLVPLTPDSREAARSELRNLVQKILSEVI
jgi:hypothetical protein